ncbi:hypothetical protein HZ326_19931 [Fusarium oxysporum f. sp. albedinis]|nr:hypothetical protein HZ326_19931 [Fusarium oxysporum f. sp. albedinis]
MQNCPKTWYNVSLCLGRKSTSICASTSMASALFIYCIAVIRRVVHLGRNWLISSLSGIYSKSQRGRAQGRTRDVNRSTVQDGRYYVTAHWWFCGSGAGFTLDGTISRFIIHWWFGCDYVTTSRN